MDLKTALGTGLLACCVMANNAVSAPSPDAPASPLIELQRKAQRGDFNAQYELAMKYLNGKGVPPNAAVASKWLRKSVEGGHLGAEYHLGLLYRDGIGVPKDIELALRWLRVAADSGLAEAQTAYDELKHAQIVREFEIVRAKAASGDAAAQYALGRRYVTGQAPLAVNPALALAWLTRAAERQHSDAQYDVGMFYKDSSSVPRDLERAKQWLAKAAAQGHIKAKVALQDIIRSEAGTAAGAGKNKFSETLPAYRAAVSGDINAQYELGLMYLRGDAVLKDYTRGIELLQHAAQQDHIAAQLQLADMYLRGVEMQPDVAAAFEWYLRAARRGDAQAQYMLGNLYRAGSGVQESPAEAHRWYTAAAQQGHLKAKERLADNAR